jgi:hypothetical protein
MSPAESQHDRYCFVIAPIGSDGSDTRQRSDDVLNYIIAPAMRECGYVPVRADQIDRAGVITSQIIEHIIDDPLVIADLTDHNPNVFYEIAIRHVTKRPIIHIIHYAQKLPFDVAMNRAIFYDHTSVARVDRTRLEISSQVRSLEEDPNNVDNPVSVSLNAQALRTSNNPIEQGLSEVLESLQAMKDVLGVLPGGYSIRWPRGHIEEAILLVAGELHKSGHLRVTSLGVPSHEVTDFVRRIGISWEVFQAAMSRMQDAGLVIGQGAAGSTYVELSATGQRLVIDDTTAAPDDLRQDS